MSGRAFTMVAPALWRSKRVKSASIEARLLYVYCLTNEHQTNAGCHRLPPGYACSDLGWTPAEFDRAREELLTLGLIEHDADTDEVFVLRWFKHSPPTNPSHRAGIMRSIDAIESDRLRTLASEEMDGEGYGSETYRAEPEARPLKAVNGGLANTPLVKRARRDG